MLALQQGTTLQLNALAYANFIAAPEITTAFILSGIIGGVVKLPIAKILNLWGRAEGFFLFVCVYLLGMIIIGLLWLLIDRLLLAPIERATIERWGLVQRA